MTPERPEVRTLPILLLGIVVGLAPSGPASGQGWTVDFHAGRASFETVPTRTASTNASLGLRHTMDRRSFQVALAAPLSSDNLFWGVAGLGDRLAFRRGRVEAGVDLMGQGHAQRDPSAEVSGWGARAEVLPMVSVSSGPLVAEARSGGSWYRAGTDGVSWSRDLWTSDLRLTGVPAPTVRISGELRHLRNQEEEYTFLGASASHSVSRAVLWASVGEWFSGLEDGASSTGWGVGASLSVLPEADVWVSVRQEPFDPVFLATSRTSWGLGVSYRLGAARTRPAPAGPEVRQRGRVVLRLPLSEASSPPSVAGDFTGWEAIAMHRHGNHWRLEVPLASGVYRYAFRSADGEWFVPEGVQGRRDDGMGGWVAVLIVP